MILQTGMRTDIPAFYTPWFLNRLRAGFVLEAVEEAFPAPETLAVPGMRDEMRRPMMLLVRAGKPV